LKKEDYCFGVDGKCRSRYSRWWYNAGATEACAQDGKKVRKKSGIAKASFDFRLNGGGGGGGDE